MSGLGSTARGAWAGRIAASGWRSEDFLAMARTLREAMDLVLGARTARPRASETSGPAADWEGVDWEGAYRARPEALERLIKTLDPGLSVVPPIGAAGSLPDFPRADSLPGQWLRDTMQRMGAIVERVDARADPETGMVPDEALKDEEFRVLVETAKANARALPIEIRVGADNATALMMSGHPSSQRSRSTLA